MVGVMARPVWALTPAHSVAAEKPCKMRKMSQAGQMRLMKLASTAAMVTTIVSSALISTFAAGSTSTVETTVKNTLNNIYSLILSIVNPVAVVCAAVALGFLLFSKNQRSVESAKSWLVRIAVAFIALNCLGLILDFFVDMTSGMSSSSNLQ